MWLTSPVSVFSSGAASVTVTDSVDEPISSVTSTRKVCSAWTVSPARMYFLNPATVTRNFIRAGRKLAERVIARGGARGLKDNAGFRVLRFDRSVCDHGSRRIRNHAGDGATVALRKCGKSEYK